VGFKLESGEQDAEDGDTEMGERCRASNGGGSRAVCYDARGCGASTNVSVTYAAPKTAEDVTHERGVLDIGLHMRNEPKSGCK
jgi:hypothetical protein